MKLQKLLAGCTATLLLQSACIVPQVFAGKTYAYGEDDAGKFGHQSSSAVLARADENKDSEQTEEKPVEEKPKSMSEVIHNPRYADDYIMIEGIDVSKYQSTIDWKAVAADGIDFAIIRLGFRGYSASGALVEDNYFRQNLEGAKAAGIDVGVYFFTQAITPTEAVEEANFVIETLQGTPLEMPVYIDIEDVAADKGRLDSAKLSPELHTLNCDAFCSTIQNAGYQAGIYANMNWLNNKLLANFLESKYPIWLANYKKQTTYEGGYDMWQYTDIGTVAGINGNVDMNVLYSRKVEFVDETIQLPTLDPVMLDFYGSGSLQFESSDPSVAEIDTYGCITPLRNGTTTITARSDNGTSDSVTVTVDTSQLTLSHELLFLTGIGATEKCIAKGMDDTVYWLSTNEKIVKVSPDGTVKAVGYGNAEIIAMDVFGNCSRCTVYVTENKVELGDCNMDGKIDALDAAEVLLFSATNGVNAGDAANHAYTLYDINEDKTVDALDASAILFHSASSGTRR